MREDLDVIEPPVKAIVYQGETLQIRPLLIGQIPAFVRATKPLIAAIVAMKTQADDGEVLQAFDTLVQLLETDGDQLTLAAAVAIGKAPDWVAQGYLDEFFVLATAIIEVNRDFFVHRLVPALAARVRARATPGDGPTASSTSSSAATD